MVKIRLFRTGTTKRPRYRVVAIEKSRARQGRFLENLGTYDPKGGGTAHLDREGIERWVAKGAQLSDTVRSLMKRPPAETTPAEVAPVPSAPETPPAPEAAAEA